MQFQLTILGVNSALPSSKHISTAQILNSNEQFFLFDCAEATQIQLRKYKFKFSKIENIFISHLHGDHYYGIFGLLSSFNLLGREKTLNIYADARLEKILTNKYSPIDISEMMFKIKFHHLNFNSDQIIFESKKNIIYSFPLRHRIPTCGFKVIEKQALPNIKKNFVNQYSPSIEEIVNIKKGADFVTKNGDIIKNSEIIISPPKPRSFAFCTDTVFSENTVQYVKNIDLLYHEATFSKDLEKEAIKTFHSTSYNAAIIAQKSGAKKLLIGHYSSRYKDYKLLENEAREIFKETYAVNEGDVFSL